MSASSEYLAAVMRALEIQGQAQSNAVLQRGQVWGNYLANLGKDIPETIQAVTEARQDQRLREAFDFAAKRAVAAGMPQYGPLDPRTVEGASAAGGAAATPAANYPTPTPDQVATPSAPLAAAPPTVVPTTATPSQFAEPGAPSDPNAQAPTTAPSAATPVASGPSDKWSALMASLTPEDKKAIKEASDKGTALPLSIIRKLGPASAAFDQSQQQPSASATTGSSPAPDLAATPPAAPAASPTAPSAATPPPTGAPPTATTPSPPPPAGLSMMPGMMPGAMQLPVSPFPTPSEIIKAVGPRRGLPIIQAIEALKLNPAGDPAETNKQLELFYKGLLALPVDMRQQAYPMLRTQAILTGGKLAPILNQVLPPNYSDVHARFFQGQLAPVKGPPDTEAKLRADAHDKNSPTSAQSAATIRDWEADREALRRQGGGGDTSKYINLMAKPESERTAAEQAWIKAYQDAKDREHSMSLDAFIQRRQYEIANPLPGTVSSQSVVVRGVDADGNPTTQIVQKVPGTTIRSAPSATIQNRTASAKVALQLSDDIEQKLQDPNYLKAIGPILGRYSQVQDWWGDPPPELRELKGMAKGYSDAMTSVHGYRSPENAARIAELLSTKSTPEAIIAALHGLNDFSMHLLENENIRITKPIPGYPGTEQTYKNGKWVRTK